MPAKTEQLQIRVTPREKAALKRLARAAAQDVSSYVLSRVVASEPQQFAAIVRALGVEGDAAYALAELNDFLARQTAATFRIAVSAADLGRVAVTTSNYVAAMVEHAAGRLGVSAPAWCGDIEPLDAPYFATSLASLRPHLLQASPVAFKRRNIFVDASVGARV